MSEIEALLGLYGAIDRAVVADEAKAADLAPLLGAYEGGAAKGWYDKQYIPWVAGVKERAAARGRAKRIVELTDQSHPEVLAGPPLADDVPPAEALPSAEDDPVTLRPGAQQVHDALAAFPAEPLEGRAAARRLLAVTAAARALPQHFGRDGSHVDVARNALVFKEDPILDPDGSLATGRAVGVHARFAEQFTSMGEWTKVVNDAVKDELLPEWFSKQAGAKPCIGRLIMRPDPDGGTDSDPCTVMEASFVTDKLTFEQAKVYLEPSNWVYPDSFWCRMERQEPAIAADTWVYHETVATSCPPETAAWTVSTDLQFWFSHPAVNEARVEYDFPKGLPTPLSDIEIDEGSLRIIGLDNAIEVITTKRVRFAGSFDGAGLSMFMCATGYSSKLEDMIFKVATTPAIKTNPFPVPAPTGGPKQGGTVTTPSNAENAKASYAGTNTGSGDESLDDVVKEAVAYVETVLKDVADTCTTSLKSVQQGTYKVENAWADGVKMWTNYATSLAKALDLGTRTVKAVTKQSSNGT